jgi:hypothetical protein
MGGEVGLSPGNGSRESRRGGRPGGDGDRAHEVGRGGGAGKAGCLAAEGRWLAGI